MLVFDNVSFAYEKDMNSLMCKTSFSVDKGEFVSIIGPSGCGKSTIFRLINGLEFPKSGEILVNKEPAGAGKCGYMPQKDLLMPWRSVHKNLQLPLELRGISKQESEQKVNKVLDAIGLKSYAQSFPRSLSGGMRQRASFGRTLLLESDVLLLDEPFSALDYLTKISMQEWLLNQWEVSKKTILFITHDVEEAILLSSRILVMGSQRPITNLDEIIVNLPYPRSRDMLEKPEIQELKENLIKKLREELAF